MTTQTLVPAVPTPVPFGDAIVAFVEAWPIAIAAPRTARSVAVAIAHCALECGNFGYRNGKPSDPPTLYNYNLGNTRPAAGEDCEVCQYPGNEVIGGKVVRFAPPDPLSTFRSFRSFREGVAAQLTFLAERTRYAQAWARLLAGDPMGFVQQLKAHGYFTGDERPYETAVTSIFSHILPNVQAAIDSNNHGFTDADRAHIDGLVALTTAESAGVLGEEFPLGESTTRGLSDV